MKRIVGALVLAALVVCGAFLRARLAPQVTTLPPSHGVVIVAIDGWDGRMLLFSQPTPSLNALAMRYPVGLLPTRSGAKTDADFDAALRMVLSGSRAPAPDALTLPEAITRAGGTFERYPLPTFPTPSRRSGRVVPRVILVTATGPNAVRQADREIGRLTGREGLPDGWTLLALGVTPSASSVAARSRIAPILFWQHEDTGQTPRLLTSPSTRRRPGLIAATDIGTTITTLLDLPADLRQIGDGRAIETTPYPVSSVSPALYLWQQSDGWSIQAREQKLLPALPWTLAALLSLSTFAGWPTLRRAAQVAALSAPLALIVMAPLVPHGIPALTFLPQYTYLLAGIVVGTLAVAAGRNGRWGERLPRLLALLTAVTIAVDTLLGGPLLARTPLSYSVLEAARFYGIGNEVSGIFLGASLIALGADVGTGATLLCGGAIALLSGMPQLGADAGGFVATLIAFAVLAFAQRSRGRTVVPAVFIAGTVIVVAVALFALWDGSRPAESRTHIGQAVTSARAHGFRAISTIATRKLSVNARLLVTSPWSILLFTEVGLLLWSYRQNKRRSGEQFPPTAVLQQGVFAAMLALFVLNDSGVVAASACGLWCFALRSGDHPLFADRRQTGSRTYTDSGT